MLSKVRRKILELGSTPVGSCASWGLASNRPVQLTLSDSRPYTWADRLITAFTRWSWKAGTELGSVGSSFGAPVSRLRFTRYSVPAVNLVVVEICATYASATRSE